MHAPLSCNIHAFNYRILQKLRGFNKICVH
nr:MAG TPA: hypothetical protein [Caudoviricetes sp.]DAV79658.1 MAG TPA: hypothetical protein [Bacteriophage sp.]